MKIKSKIGILNFQYSNDNYGAVLQAASLEYIIKSQGGDVEHINYIPRNNLLRVCIYNILVLLGLRGNNLSIRKRDSSAFELFRNSFINRSATVRTVGSFKKIIKNYDIVVVGSDQVWRPTMAGDPLVFFLNYVDERIKKISYAASFGVKNWESQVDGDFTRQVKDNLNRFQAVSVRESSGVQICNKIFNVNAIHVLDPLLLVSDEFIYKIISKSNIKNYHDFVFYKLDMNNDFLDKIEYIEKKFDCNSYNIYMDTNRDDAYEYVENWVDYIFNSKVVITDSFHCACLAFRFGKDVVFCPNSKRGNARFESLFKVFNIDLDLCRIEEYEDLFYIPVIADYSSKIDRLKKISHSYISNNILN